MKLLFLTLILTCTFVLGLVPTEKCFFKSTLALCAKFYPENMVECLHRIKPTYNKIALNICGEDDSECLELRNVCPEYRFVAVYLPEFPLTEEYEFSCTIAYLTNVGTGSACLFLVLITVVIIGAYCRRVRRDRDFPRYERSFVEIDSVSISLSDPVPETSARSNPQASNVTNERDETPRDTAKEKKKAEREPAKLKKKAEREPAKEKKRTEREPTVEKEKSKEKKEPTVEKEKSKEKTETETEKTETETDEQETEKVGFFNRMKNIRRRKDTLKEKKEETEKDKAEVEKKNTTLGSEQNENRSAKVPEAKGEKTNMQEVNLNSDEELKRLIEWTYKNPVTDRLKRTKLYTGSTPPPFSPKTGSTESLLANEFLEEQQQREKEELDKIVNPNEQHWEMKL